MKFAASLKSLVLLAASLALVACGGGGGSDSDSGFTPAGLSLTTSTGNVSLNPRSLTTITATLRQANGAAVADGATVTATVSGAGIGNVSANVHSKIVAHSVQMGVKLMSGVKNIIAVASGKGSNGVIYNSFCGISNRSN